LVKIQQYLAYNEQAREDGDKPGLEAMLQKVLQLYASKVLSKRSYAMKGKLLFDTLELESLTIMIFSSTNQFSVI